MKGVTWKDLEALFPKKYKPSNGSIKDDLFWWCAYSQSEEWIDSSRKGIAFRLLDGSPPIGQRAVVAYVNELITQDMCDVDFEEAKQKTLNEIRKFYK